MKKVLLGASAIVAVAALSSSAFAADLPARTYTKAPVYTAPAAVYNWTGFYIGGHLGGAFGDGSGLAGSDGRFMGGVQGGADYQFANNWVLGVEAQYSWMNSNNTALVYPLAATQVTGGSDQLGSVTGRLGYSFGPALLYAKGGYAWRNGNNLGVTSTITGLPVAYTATGSKDGYTVGAGLEYMFTQNWSGKIEYQYYNFGSTTFTSGPITGASFNNDEHTIKAGLNYRFGWGGPTVASY